jgi:hypothetical protein
MELPTPMEGINELRDKDRLRAAMMAAGFVDVSIIEVTNDFLVDEAELADPDRSFPAQPSMAVARPQAT